MGVYLNSKTPYKLYKNESIKPYFIDKTLMLQELIPYVEGGNSYICITRPRRFGKTVMANMIGAFLGKGRDSAELFSRLAISANEYCSKHRNQHNVIDISLNELPKDCRTYDQYIDRIQNRLMRDLKRAYPECEIDDSEAVWDALNDIYEMKDASFVFIMDEWDFIFHRDFITEDDKKKYLSFLSSLLKDKPYVSLTYMTGILPIAKYSSGSELNMFLEYSMASQIRFSEYFGFTESEVDMLYQRYLNNEKDRNITREGLRIWYNGYHTLSGERIYNPRSVVAALGDNQLGNIGAVLGHMTKSSFILKVILMKCAMLLLLWYPDRPYRQRFRNMRRHP